MAGVSRVGRDRAGGILLPSQNSTVFMDGALAAVLHCNVTDHGDSPHDSARMVRASSTVFVQGMPVCRAGDSASCGDTATGSGSVLVGG